MLSKLFYLFVFFLPFMSLFVLEVGFTLKLSDILALILMGAALTCGAVRRYKNKEFKIYFSDLSPPLILFLFACLVSTNQTGRVPVVEFGLKEAVGRNTPQLRSITTFGWALFSYFIFLLVINIVKTKQILLKALKIYLVSSSVVCAYGLYQLFGHLLGLKTDLRFPESVWVVPRINATLSEPLILANYLISAIVFTLAIFLSKEKMFNRYLAGVILLVQMVSIALTFSVSGLAALVISITALLIINRRYVFRRRRFVYLILISIVIVRLIFMWMPSPISRVIEVSVDKLTGFRTYSQMPVDALRQHPSAYSQQDRFWLWGAAVNMFKAHPLLGVGAGNFGFHYNAYRPAGAEYKDYLTLPNNQYLEILAETGILGMACFLYIIFHLSRLIVIAFKKTSDYTLRIILGALGAIFIGWMIQYCFFSTLYIIYIWALLGITAAAARLAVEGEGCA